MSIRGGALSGRRTIQAQGSGTHARYPVAATAVAGAGIIHAAQVPVHMAEWAPAGLYLATTAVVQMGLAAALWGSTGTRLRWFAVSVNASAIVLWIVSRTVGIPIGPAAGLRETIGRPDAVVTTLELITIVAVAGAWREIARPARVRIGAAVAVLVVAVTAWAVAPGSDGHAHVAADGSPVHVHSAGDPHSSDHDSHAAPGTAPADEAQPVHFADDAGASDASDRCSTPHEHRGPIGGHSHVHGDAHHHRERVFGRTGSSGC